MAALTRRERKVKDILLKELREIADFKRLSYAEKQRLEKTIDHEFIDAELAKMRKSLRRQEKMNWFFVPLAVFCVTFFAYSLGTDGGAAEWFDLTMPLYGVFPAVGFHVQIKSTRRKIFIYEALRELSDADEAGVQLDRAIREADELIERVIRRELGEEALPAKESANSHAPSAAPVAPRQRAARTASTKGVTLTEMQRQKEAGSTILDS